MTYLFASDLHGLGRPWIELMEQARRAYPQAQIVLGGDYIDGYLTTFATITYLQFLVREHHAVLLWGNHEDLLYNFVTTGDERWLANGGEATAYSLIGPTVHRQQTRHLLAQHSLYRWLKRYRNHLVYQTDHLTFVHTGVRPDGQPTDHQYQLWARQEYWYGDNPRYQTMACFAPNQTGHTIVTGHTPTALINGVIEAKPIPPNQPPIVGYHDATVTDCPVLKVQYQGEPARYFTDGGITPHWSDHRGNIVAFADDGRLLRVFH